MKEIKTEIIIEEQGSGDIIDLEIFAREDKQVPHGKKYKVKIGHEYFIFHHHIVTGKELLEKAGKIPVECHTLYQKFKHHHDAQKIDLHQKVDLSQHGVEHFIVKPPEEFHFLVDGEKETTRNCELTPNEILGIAKKLPVADYYLVQIFHDDKQKSYKGLGDIPIKMECPAMKFSAVYNGEVPVS